MYVRLNGSDRVLRKVQSCKTDAKELQDSDNGKRQEPCETKTKAGQETGPGSEYATDDAVGSIGFGQCLRKRVGFARTQAQKMERCTSLNDSNDVTRTLGQTVARDFARQCEQSEPRSGHAYEQVYRSLATFCHDSRHIWYSFAEIDVVSAGSWCYDTVKCS